METSIHLGEEHTTCFKEQGNNEERVRIAGEMELKANQGSVEVPAQSAVSKSPNEFNFANGVKARVSSTTD